MVRAVVGREHYQTQLFAPGGHELIADEPEELGGTNLGPAPGELLMLSLASCTAITVRMYADRKTWPLESVAVEVDLEKVDTTNRFKREVKLTGALSDEQRQRLLQIANACPVHKVLTGPIEIETNLI
jgi:putative redox protein